MSAPDQHLVARALWEAGYQRAGDPRRRTTATCTTDGYLVESRVRNGSRIIVVSWRPPGKPTLSDLVTSREWLARYADTINGHGWTVSMRTHDLVVTSYPEGPAELQIADDVLTVLDDSTAGGTHLFLPPSLDRGLSQRADQVLRAAGGKWDRRVRAHVFKTTAAEARDVLLLTGHIVTARDLGCCPTPHEVVCRILDAAQVEDGHAVLEPSAGTGAIAEAAAALTDDVDCIEIDPGRAAEIRAGGYARNVWTVNFLNVPVIGAYCGDGDASPGYDRIVMNPPFACRADLRHVDHAMGFVRPGGRVVAVMSAGVLWRQDSDTREFRERVAVFAGSITALPDDSFKVSGIRVKTALVVVDRPDSGSDG